VSVGTRPSAPVGRSDPGAASALTRKDLVAAAKRLQSAKVRPIFDIAATWAQIATAIALFYVADTYWLYAPLILFVSARQYGLLILLHDGQHNLLSRHKRINDWLSTWLIAAPMGTHFSSSTQSHLDHHFHFGDAAQDPDYALYCHGQPAPKQTRMQVAGSFGMRIVGGKLVSVLQKALRGKDKAGPGATAPAAPLATKIGALLPIAATQLALFAALTWLFGPVGYFAIWFVPLVTLAVFYNDFRIFCEHSVIGRDPADGAERLTSFTSHPIERFFFAPHHMNYHAEHHLFPYVPHAKLPALRRLIGNCPEVARQIEWRGSYVGHVMRYVARSTPIDVAAKPAIGREQ
jgi:fatty acid desaturase